MLDQKIIFSEERQTWNLFVNGEWYYEGDYETCEEMMFNNACDESSEEDDYYREIDLANNYEDYEIYC